MFVCIFCIFWVLCVQFFFFAIFVCFIEKVVCIFCIFFSHFLLSGAVCVVDLSDIDNIGDNQHGESYFIGNKQNSSKNLSYCLIHRFLESIRSLTADDLLFFDIKKRRWHLRLKHGAPLEKVFVPE